MAMAPLSSAYLLPHTHTLPHHYLHTRMVCRTDECYQFDAKGKLKTHWLWSDTSSYSVHLPLVLRVNSHITVRYNNQVRRER